jgi:hypothetical protein
LENTLVAYIPDQGFANGEHGLKQKVAPYEAAYSSPFIVSMPGTVPAGKKETIHAGVPYYGNGSPAQCAAYQSRNRRVWNNRHAISSRASCSVQPTCSNRESGIVKGIATPSVRNHEFT